MSSDNWSTPLSKVQVESKHCTTVQAKKNLEKEILRIPDNDIWTLRKNYI